MATSIKESVFQMSRTQETLEDSVYWLLQPMILGE